MPWLIPIVASVAGAGISGAMNNSADGGQSGYDVVTPPYYNENAGINYQNNLKSSAYLQSMLASLKAGVMPPGMETVLRQIQESKMRELKEGMYGQPGRPGGGVADAVDSDSTRFSLGPKQAVSAKRTAYMDYADRQRQVSDFINQNKYNYMADASLKVPGMMQNSANPGQATMMRYGMQGAPGVGDLGLGKVDWAQLINGNNTTKTDPTAGVVVPSQQLTVNDYISGVQQPSKSSIGYTADDWINVLNRF